jgi:hypothetical protein
MPDSNTASSASNRARLLFTFLSLFIINGAIPFGCYSLLKTYHASDLLALGVAAIAPALEALISVLRSRQVNIISLFVLAGLVVGIISTFLGGDTRVFLLRDSLITAVLGVTCFASLLFPRPLMFLVGRSLIAGNDAEHIARYNQLWPQLSVQRMSRVITVVWGIVYTGDFLAHLFLVLTLPVAAVLAIGPILTNGLIGVSILWTLAYLRRRRRDVRTLRADEEALSTTNKQSITSLR